MKRPAKKRVVKPRAPVESSAATKLPVEPGSLFDMDQTGALESPESFAAEKVADAISEPLLDVSGVQRVEHALGSDQRSADQDAKNRFPDPSRIIEAENLTDDAFTQDDSSGDGMLGTFPDDDDSDDEDGSKSR